MSDRDQQGDQKDAPEQDEQASAPVEDLDVQAEESEDVKGGLNFTKRVDKASPEL